MLQLSVVSSMSRYLVVRTMLRFLLVDIMLRFLLTEMMLRSLLKELMFLFLVVKIILPSSIDLNNTDKKEENKISELGPQRMLYLFIRGSFHTSTRAHPLHFFTGLLFHHSTCIRFASPVRCQIHFAASHLGIFYLLPIFNGNLHLVTNWSCLMRLHQQVDPLG